MSKSIYQNLETYFPSVAKDAVEITERGSWELIVRVSGGAVYSYDNFHMTIRRLPADRDNMSENEFRNEFGRRLRARLDHNHISQGKLSEMTGISQVGISKYVNGTRTPSFYIVDRIAKALNCSSDEFRY